jgi:serine/threonine protein phosphatase 1
MWVIGDVHGEYKALQKLLKEIPATDPICFVGDLMDRGPESVEVIQFVMDNYDRMKCVKGNHSQMMLEFYESGARSRMGDVWLMNGGKKVYDAYKYKHGNQKLTDHLNFLRSLPYYIEFKDVKDEDGRYLLVSHSVAVSTDLERCVASESLIWGRHFPEADPSAGKWYNIYGHTPLEFPYITDWCANIDTGACFGGHLTALKYPEMECKMVKNPK